MASSSRHFLHTYVTLSLIIRNISLGTLLSNTPDCPSLSFTHSVFGLTMNRERMSVHFGVHRAPPQLVSYTAVHMCVPEFDFRTEGDEATRRMHVGLPQTVHRPRPTATLTTSTASQYTHCYRTIQLRATELGGGLLHAGASNSMCAAW